ncbi:MMPL family transporter [Micromonospora mangrovi]|uniref:MMPL family transporter n=1 Tax=Micromonospora sp. CCTCC AA 2012012 TaxID=3111921 RepID=A0AAU8HG32_9ACTN
MVLAGPLAGKVGDIQKNESEQWLPDRSEAAKVLDEMPTFQGQKAAPAIVVYERTSGITPADQERAAADAQRLGGVEGLAGPVSPPVPAKDGKALQVIVPLSMAGDGWSQSATRVDAIRDVVGKGGDQLTVVVAGPAAIFADQADAFDGIDATLTIATVAVVVVILLFTYRSPFLWLLPVVSAGLALMSSQAVIYLLAKHAGLTVSGQGAGILTVLVFGAATDYALLLIARYREELTRHEDRHVAMSVALRQAGPAIVASAGTVAIGLLCLVVAQMSSTRGLGPVVAIGITVGLIAMMTLLPALLVIFGRWLFWPVRPKAGVVPDHSRGLWARIADAVARRPRPAWIAIALVLAVLTLGVVQLDAHGFAAENAFVKKPAGVTAQETLARHFEAGQGQPVVVIGNASAAPQLTAAFQGTDGIAQVGEPQLHGDRVMLQGTLKSQPDSDAATDTVKRVRDAVHAVPGADAITGGNTATALDVSEASARDNRLIIPLVLLVVLIILGLLLRAVVAPVMLIATVVLSFGAALGVSTLVFRHVFGFTAADTSFPLFVFVFLVALGVDYNIFLMTRVREEAAGHDPTESVKRALTSTGGVITSAGLVLAGTFAALATLPLVFFAELGFAVALGVLLDTMVVRSVLVPALSIDLGRRLWWPAAPARTAEEDMPVPAGRS